MAINTYLSIIILNVKGLNVPIKRHRVAEWIGQAYICRLQETHLRMKDTHRLKVNKIDGKRYFMKMEIKKKAGVAILIFDRTDFKTKAIIRDKEGPYIIIKESFQQEGVTFVNISVPNIEALKYIKQVNP